MGEKTRWEICGFNSKKLAINHEIKSLHDFMKRGFAAVLPVLA
jgi:hypothetical protein